MVIKIRNILVTFLPFILLWELSAYSQEKWVLEKKEAGIQIFLREVAGSGLKEFKGVIYLNNTRLASLVKLLDDTESYTDWVHNCKEAKLLNKISERERITYMVIDSPWPVRDRDSINYSIINQDAKSLAIRIQVIGKMNFIGEKPGLVRIPIIRGYWLFKPLKDGTTMVVYQMHSEPGGFIPDWLANSSVVDIPYFTLLKLRAMVKKKKYRDATYPQVRESLP
jgi:hypothetical protein